MIKLFICVKCEVQNIWRSVAIVDIWYRNQWLAEEYKRYHIPFREYLIKFTYVLVFSCSIFNKYHQTIFIKVLRMFVFWACFQCFSNEIYKTFYFQSWQQSTKLNTIMYLILVLSLLQFLYNIIVTTICYFTEKRVIKIHYDCLKPCVLIFLLSYIGLFSLKHNHLHIKTYKVVNYIISKLNLII